MPTRNYILLGPPGSGKSTQAERLKQALSLTHIDMGSALRAAAREDTPFGRKLNEIINQRHELVSDEIMEEVLVQVIRRAPENIGVLIDGTPRRASQIDAVVRVLQSSGRAIKGVIFINLSEKEAVERISKRYLCQGCLRPYIWGKDLFSQTEVCGTCGGKIAQRADDTPEGVRTRYQIFHSETLPVIDYFEKMHLLLRIDGDQDAETTFRNIIDHLDK
jgi:adenylate kinase